MSRRLKNLSVSSLRYIILCIIIVVVAIVFSIVSPYFLQLTTFMNIIKQTAALARAAIGMTLIILTGGIDLASGKVIAFAAVCGACVMNAMGDGVSGSIVALLVTVLAAMAVGAVNGFLVGTCGIGAFMATLATQYAVYGLTLKITNASRIVISSSIYNFLGASSIGKIGTVKIPGTLIAVILCYVVAFFIFNKTKFGRYTYAVGGNKIAARAAGINVKKQLVLVYMFGGITFAIASIITAGRAASAQPLAGEGFEFQVITAVVIGGTSLMGGVGTIGGTLLGSILIGLITTGLGLVDVAPYVNYCIKGLLIFAAVLLNMYFSKLSASQKAKAELQKAATETKEQHADLEKEPVVAANNAEVIERLKNKEIEHVLKLEHISKTFPGVKALDDVTLELKSGKVHALMGENGAGKSTLMKVLSGVYQKNGGRITIDGIPVDISSPIDSSKLGISVIYQELEFVPELSVAQNIFMGKELVGKSGMLLDLKKMAARAKELMNSLGMDINVTKKANSYAVAQLQMVEIAKAIDSNAWVVVMDEPTAAITEADKDKLFELIRKLKEQGIAIVYISHRMSEIFDIADEVSVLRDGQLIATYDIDEVDEATLIKNMVGHEVNNIFDRDKTASDENPVVLEVRNLYKKGVFEPISFKVRAGEVLGFSGLIGAGRTEIMRCIFGLDRPDGGEIWLNGEKVEIHSPLDAIKKGICLVSEDRRKEGIVAEMSVLDNVTLPSLPWISRMNVIDNQKEQEIYKKYGEALKIKTPTPEQLIGNLSGGNQQKCCLAKWLARSPKLIILDEPTRGIDVGVKSEIHDIIDDLTKQGMAVIMISSELPEIIGASDRIVVLYEGNEMGIFDSRHDEITQETLMHAASGFKKETGENVA